VCGDVRVHVSLYGCACAKLSVCAHACGFVCAHGLCCWVPVTWHSGTATPPYQHGTRTHTHTHAHTHYLLYQTPVSHPGMRTTLSKMRLCCAHALPLGRQARCAPQSTLPRLVLLSCRFVLCFLPVLHFSACECVYVCMCHNACVRMLSRPALTSHHKPRLRAYACVQVCVCLRAQAVLALPRWPPPRPQPGRGLSRPPSPLPAALLTAAPLAEPPATTVAGC